MANYSLAPLELADFEAALALWNASPGVRAAETREEFTRILARNPGLGSAAWVDGELVGGVLCTHDGRRGYLYHLAVAAPFRQQKIATALVERSLSLLASQGISRCSIFLIADNEAGAQFWLKTGWRERTDLRLMAIDLLP